MTDNLKDFSDFTITDKDLVLIVGDYISAALNNTLKEVPWKSCLEEQEAFMTLHQPIEKFIEINIEDQNNKINDNFTPKNLLVGNPIYKNLD